MSVKEWVKENPGKSTAIGLAALAALIYGGKKYMEARKARQEREEAERLQKAMDAIPQIAQASAAAVAAALPKDLVTPPAPQPPASNHNEVAALKAEIAKLKRQHSRPTQRQTSKPTNKRGRK